MLHERNDFVITTGRGREKFRELRVKVGSTYRIEPSNPLKKKHRGRVCTLVEAVDSSGKDIAADVAVVRFADSNRIGKVDLGDLYEIAEPTTEKKSHGSSTGKDWADKEVAALVVDYFSMLEKELLGDSYSKSEHRKSLSPRLEGRSTGSIEFKHQNVSSVLVELSLPYIEGYKPRGNYQESLAVAVEDFLEQSPGLLERLAAAPKINPTQHIQPAVRDWQSVVELPPDKIIAPTSAGKPWLTRRKRKIDFAERDSMNRHLGRLGEQFVVDFERHRLNSAGRDDLAQRVLWASREIGDGLGFDVLSFNEHDDSELMLEVKATGLGKFFPFYVTSNEVRCSEDLPAQFRLYRVFDFTKAPRLYMLKGSLRACCNLDPVLFRAVI